MAGTLEARPVRLGTIDTRVEEGPLRVLAVTPLPSSRASMIHVTRQVASLEVSGITCKTFTVASRTSPWVVLGEWRRLRREIRAFQPDIVHAHYGTMTAFLAILSTTLPVIVTYRGSDLNPNRSRGWLREALGTLLSQIAALRAARIICVSNQLKHKLWWRRDRVIVIPTGVDMTLFYPRDLQEARRELEWGKEEHVVLFNAGDPICKRCRVLVRKNPVCRPGWECSPQPCSIDDECRRLSIADERLGRLSQRGQRGDCLQSSCGFGGCGRCPRTFGRSPAIRDCSPGCPRNRQGHFRDFEAGQKVKRARVRK